MTCERSVIKDAVVKITPNATIHVKASPNGFEGGSSLKIDNSKLFACDGLWEGIRTGLMTSVITANATAIEDARIAIQAVQNGAALSIDNTIFNRNEIGIEVIGSDNLVSYGPNIWTFNNNAFTCTAPLNGTVNGVSLAGVRLDNAQLFAISASVTTNNSFRGLQYGIYAKGAASFVVAKRMRFRDMKRAGIFMEIGNLRLNNSQFLECFLDGIKIEQANNVQIADNLFYWGTGLYPTLPVPTASSIHNGIDIYSFRVGSTVNIERNGFIAGGIKHPTFFSLHGINLSYPSEGTNIKIFLNKFYLTGESITGIKLTTYFPLDCVTEILGNRFDIQKESIDGGLPLGVDCQGNKNNIHIISNIFNTDVEYPGGVGWANPIHLAGIEGAMNEVSGNFFGDPINPIYFDLDYAYGIDIVNSRNIIFCDNTFWNTQRAFVAHGMCDGTVLNHNISHGGQIIYVEGESFIGQQIDMGNQWWGQSAAQSFAFQAECEIEDLAPFSAFFVHLEQSTALTGPGSNPFHPFGLFPDNNEFEWWIRPLNPGAPSQGGCVLGEPALYSEGTKVKNSIASGTLPFTEFDASFKWQAERALYFDLKQNPSLLNGSSLLGTFLTNNANSNIAKLYQVSALIRQAYKANAVLTPQIKENQDELEKILDDLEEIWTNNDQIDISHGSMQSSDQQILISKLVASLTGNAEKQKSAQQAFKAGLGNASAINNLISTNTDWEKNEKIVNAYQLGFLLGGNAFSEVNLDDIQKIAEQCPKYGGIAVYGARSLLPNCMQKHNQDDYEGCYPTPLAPKLSEKPNTADISLQENAVGVIYPNPVEDMVTLSTKEGMSGTAQILNSMEQVVSTITFKSSQTEVNTSHLESGIYAMHIKYTDGPQGSIRFVVIKQK